MVSEVCILVLKNRLLKGKNARVRGCSLPIKK
jgi:hypothetical protein